MDAILEGRRSGFARRGPKERLSKEMILKAQEGNYDWIYGILRDNLASPDVADAKGYTVLAAAAVSTQPPCVGGRVTHRTAEPEGPGQWPLVGGACPPPPPCDAPLWDGRAGSDREGGGVPPPGAAVSGGCL